MWSELSRLVRLRGVDAPHALDRSRSVEAIWRDEALLFGQACGYPLVSEADLLLRVIGVPVYNVPGCAPGQHLSHIVTRRDDSGRTRFNDESLYAACARFAFRNRDAQRSVGSLSGGERLRAGLAAVLSGPKPPWLLILGEPTNHLDTGSIKVLERSLQNYDGALLVVSHDDSFRKAIGIEQRRMSRRSKFVIALRHVGAVVR